MSPDDPTDVAQTKAAAEASSVLPQRLESLLTQLTSQQRLKHALMAVERTDGSFRWAGATGESTPDGVPMRADTPFFLASVTKLYTATVILKLQERGKLSVDDPITSYLSPSLISGLHRLGGVDYTSQITVRHLLAHTSGLADYFEERPRGGKSLADRLFDEGDMAWTVEDVVRLVRDELVPHFPPQSTDAKRQQVRYSDTNYQLLGAIVESATAQSLQEVFETLLFRPLNLRHTYLAGRSRPLDLTAEPAALWFDGRPLHLPLAMRSFGADGGLVSTADDALAFLRALVSGSVFDDPATLDSMQQRWNRFGLPLDQAALRAPSWPIEYGLGMMRFHLPRIFALLNPVPAVIGHTGSTGCWLFYCPQLQALLSGTVDQPTAGALPFRFIPRVLQVLARSWPAFKT